jgi:hypothetical protein
MAIIYWHLLQASILILPLFLQFCVPWQDWTISETREVVIIIMHVHGILNLRGKYFDKNDANFFCSLIISSCSSYFTSLYMSKWKEFFPHKELMLTPRFEAEAVCYPKLKIACEYLSWRQAECTLSLEKSTSGLGLKHICDMHVFICFIRISVTRLGFGSCVPLCCDMYRSMSLSLSFLSKIPYCKGLFTSSVKNKPQQQRH